MFRNQEKMSQEQQSVAEYFINMVESEYALCVREFTKADQAIVTPAAELTEEEIRRVDVANREINAISKYWQLRLSTLIEFIEAKNRTINKELADKYLKGQYGLIYTRR